MIADRMIIFTIVLSGLVTWLPRIIPFVLAKKFDFPPSLKKFLSFLPMCILTALFVQTLLIPQEKGLPLLNLTQGLASLPTILVAAKTKNLMLTVIVGVLSMAALRFFM